jgi:indole-3-glycerol phosphate synthase
MSILKTIVEHKKKEIASCKQLISLKSLKEMPQFKRLTFGFRESILHPEKTGIIAEFKRKSPSKGIINDQVRVEDVTKGYTRYGASALSVLTDFGFFGGSVDDLQKARVVNQLPILRKDFIIDPYQVYEAKALGADAILLIAAILKKKEAEELALLARDLGMQILMEIHNEHELEMLNESLDIVGVNNRDLKTFEVNLEHSARLSSLIPDHFVKISESGISTPEDIQFLKKYGYRGFLIGENFMKTDDPAIAFANFVKTLKR